MKIQKITGQKLNFGFNLKGAISGSKRPVKEIESSLFNNYGIQADFKNNSVVANCVDKTVNIFSEIFPESYLPKKIGFESFKEILPQHPNAQGVFFIPSKKVCFNTRCAEYKAMPILKMSAALDHIYQIPLVIPKANSTTNMLHGFVHEFAHCAHEENIIANGKDVFESYSKEIPYLYGVISKTKLGRYAFKTKDTCELIAETLTKQILEYPETIKSGDMKTLFRFSPIRTEDAKNYMQALWNGNLEQIEQLGKKLSVQSKVIATFNPFEQLSKGIKNLRKML